MKTTKYILGIMMSAALLFTGCMKKDIDELRKQQAENAAHNTISALEEWQKVVNVNITTLQRFVAALQGNDYVTGVTSFDIPAPGGYRITFGKSGEVTIWNRAKGDGGAAPAIGVKQDTDGKYYWTLDGEFIEASGRKMPVAGDPGETGATPKVAIGSDNYWYVSADGTAVGTPPGAGWTNTDVKATGDQGDAIFAADGVDDTNDDYVIFTLADGTTKITLPKYVASLVSFESYDLFYGSSTNNEITIVLPPTLKETDYTALAATISDGNGTVSDIQTRAGSGSSWQVSVTKPTFTDGVLDAGSAKVVFTAPETYKLSETAMLTITLIDANGREHSVSRPVKYFDGMIVHNKKVGFLRDEVSDHSITNLAVTGEMDFYDFLFIKENLAALEVLDISMAEITEIPNEALRYSSSNTTLRRVALPATVETIGNIAFGKCAGLEYMDIPNVKTLGEYAFWDCTNLKEIRLGNKLETIGRFAFSQCRSLSALELPNSLRTLAARAFAYSGLVSLVIPTTLKQIPDYTFDNCTNLERVTLHDGISHIGQAAFLRCRSLKQVKIPAGVTRIENNTFDECISLEFVDFHDEIKYIGERAFAYCHNLRGSGGFDRFALPNDLQTMGDGAFQECRSLKVVEIPSLKDLPENAFFSCTNLATIFLPDNMKTIGRQCFLATAITAIAFPASLTSIGEYAFSGCSKLVYVSSKATKAPLIGTYTFDNVYKAARNLYRPSGADYSSWAEYFNMIYNN